MIVCAVCALPAEVTGTFELDGVDFHGNDAVFVLVEILCLAGHRYHRVGETRVAEEIGGPW